MTVYPKAELINAAPVITANDKTLTVGDTFDAKADVTAKDAEDGDLTQKIEVINNTVNTSKAGSYEVTYKVTDSQGASVTKTISVTVKAKDTLKPTPDRKNNPSGPSTDKK
ncbi:MAG: immunoglobulin-like domain-containing protein [Coprococcus sp.]